MAVDYSTSDIIKNNELLRGKFSLRDTNIADLSYKEFFPPTTQSISIEGLDFIISHFKEPVWPQNNIYQNTRKTIILFIAGKK
jgi:hypothetical protein